MNNVLVASTVWRKLHKKACNGWLGHITMNPGDRDSGLLQKARKYVPEYMVPYLHNSQNQNMVEF
jgi:Fe-S cluster biosynthesis and repair protein YggX